MTIDEGKVLICDDSILARKQIKDIIAIAGAPTIFEASDGEKAIEIYKEHKPDLVFCAGWHSARQERLPPARNGSGADVRGFLAALPATGEGGNCPVR